MTHPLTDPSYLALGAPDRRFVVTMPNAASRNLALSCRRPHSGAVGDWPASLARCRAWRSFACDPGNSPSSFPDGIISIVRLPPRPLAVPGTSTTVADWICDQGRTNSPEVLPNGVRTLPPLHLMPSRRTSRRPPASSMSTVPQLEPAHPCALLDFLPCRATLSETNQVAVPSRRGGAACSRRADSGGTLRFPSKRRQHLRDQAWIQVSHGPNFSGPSSTKPIVGFDWYVVQLETRAPNRPGMWSRCLQLMLAPLRPLNRTPTVQWSSSRRESRKADPRRAGQRQSSRACR